MRRAYFWGKMATQPSRGSPAGRLMRQGFFRGWVGRLTAVPEADLKGLRGRGVRLLRVFYFAYRNFLRNLCWERAATLSFATLVSLIPLTVLFIGIMVSFWTEERWKDFARKLVDYLVPASNLRNQLWDTINTELSKTAFQFQSWVSVVAVLGLVITSVGLLVSAERVFNRIWDVSVSRTYMQKLWIFWVVLTTSPVALGVSLYFDQLARRVLGDLRDSLFLDTLYSFFLPALVSFLAFTILNKFLPSARVRLGPAMLGALVTSLLWEAAKKGFYVYVQNLQGLPSFAKIYGSLGIVPVFLLWVYLTWLVILYGVEVTHAAQNMRELSRLEKAATLPPPPASPVLAVYVLERVYGAFVSGRSPPFLEEIAEGTGLTGELLEPLMKRLVEKGFLIEDAKALNRYAPARAPGKVRIREVVEGFLDGLLSLEGARGLERAREEGRKVLSLFEGARGAFLGFLGDRTLEDLLVNRSDKSN